MVRIEVRMFSNIICWTACVFGGSRGGAAPPAGGGWGGRSPPATLEMCEHAEAAKTVAEKKCRILSQFFPSSLASQSVVKPSWTFRWSAASFTQLDMKDVCHTVWTKSDIQVLSPEHTFGMGVFSAKVGWFRGSISPKKWLQIDTFEHDREALFWSKLQGHKSKFYYSPCTRSNIWISSFFSVDLKNSKMVRNPRSVKWIRENPRGRAKRRRE